MKHKRLPHMTGQNLRAARVPRLPRGWERFAGRYPIAAAAYDAFSDACRHAGPLDERTIALAKLAISVGGGIDRTVHVHAKKALRAGVTADALMHVALIAMPTIGLARAMDALRWIEESVEEARAEEGPRAIT